MISFINAMRQIGLFLLVVAFFLALVGLLLIFLPQLPRLPGDIVIKKKNVTVFIPLGTSILLSLLLTIILNLLFKK